MYRRSMRTLSSSHMLYGNACGHASVYVHVHMLANVMPLGSSRQGVAGGIDVAMVLRYKCSWLRSTCKADNYFVFGSRSNS